MKIIIIIIIKGSSRLGGVDKLLIACALIRSGKDTDAIKVI